MARIRAAQGPTARTSMAEPLGPMAEPPGRFKKFSPWAGAEATTALASTRRPNRNVPGISLAQNQKLASGNHQHAFDDDREGILRHPLQDTLAEIRADDEHRADGQSQVDGLQTQK